MGRPIAWRVHRPRTGRNRRLRYLAAVGVQDPWQERRDDGNLENAVKITAVPYHGDAPAEMLHIVMLYEECFGQTAKTMLAETFAKSPQKPLNSHQDI